MPSGDAVVWAHIGIGDGRERRVRVELVLGILVRNDVPEVDRLDETARHVRRRGAFADCTALAERAQPRHRIEAAGQIRIDGD